MTRRRVACRCFLFFMSYLHRNSQKRFYGSDKIYFIVTKTFKNYPYFKEPIFCELFIEELKICKQLKQFKLYGFCIIYDHLNLLIQPNEKYNISNVMQAIKKETSRDINRIILNNIEGDIPECRLHECRLQARGLIAKFQNQFIKKYKNNEWPEFRWQKSFHDHVIRNKKDFINHYNYTVYNFIKHNLSENWRYTSLNYEELIDEINF